MSSPNPVSNYRTGQALAGFGCGAIAFVFVMLGLSSAAGGASQVAQSTKYRQPIKMTYEEFVKQHPTEGWYHLSGVSLVIPGSRWTTRKYRRSGSETITATYVPLASAKKDAEDEEKIHIILSTEDPTVQQRLKELEKLEMEKPEKETIEYLAKHLADLYPERDVEGMVAPISELDSDHIRSFEEDGLAKDAVLLLEGERPDEGGGHFLQGFGTFMMIIAGIVSLIGVWFIVQMQKDLKLAKR